MWRVKVKTGEKQSANPRKSARIGEDSSAGMDPCRSQEGDSAEVSGGIDARHCIQCWS